VIALHADWSMHAAKRYHALARRVDDFWALAAPRLVGEPMALLAPLLAEGVPVAMGLDLPLGLPRAYAAHCAEADFPAFLRARLRTPEFFAVNETLATISRERPFYPARGVKGMTRLSHARALGMADAGELSRHCDRATALRPAGAPVFWTLGANQSGKAAISAWRDWLAPAMAAGAPLALWPFEGALHDLLRPGRVVLAEVYPAEALRQLGLKLAGSKRDQGVRRALAPALRDALDRARARPDAALEATIADGFGADAAGEDRLDCVLGLLCMLQVLDGRRADHVPEDRWIRQWEGWVLGQA
jgi:hypothetical protein